MVCSRNLAEYYLTAITLLKFGGWRLTPNFFRRIYGGGQKFGGYGDWRRLRGLALTSLLSDWRPPKTVEPTQSTAWFDSSNPSCLAMCVQWRSAQFVARSSDERSISRLCLLLAASQSASVMPPPVTQPVGFCDCRNDKFPIFRRVQFASVKMKGAIDIWCRPFTLLSLLHVGKFG